MSAFTPQPSLTCFYLVLDHVACASHLVIVNRLWLLELPSDNTPSTPRLPYPSRPILQVGCPITWSAQNGTQPLLRVRSVLYDVWRLHLRSTCFQCCERAELRP